MGEPESGPGDGGDRPYHPPSHAERGVQVPGLCCHHRRYGDLCGPRGKGFREV